MYIISVDPVTRINDQFAQDASINCLYPSHDLISELVSSSANQTRYGADFYENIALDIVNETVFDYPYPCITEKTLRPIACKRMFVIVGPAGILNLLHQLGFESWGDIIDESYDSLTDPQERFLSVVNSINEFCQLPLDEIKKFLTDNQSRLEYNYSIFQNLKNQELNKIKKIIERK